MIAVGGANDGCVVVACVFAHGELGAVGQKDVVFGETFFHKGGG